MTASLRNGLMCQRNDERRQQHDPLRIQLGAEPIGDAAAHAVQECPKRRESVADVPYSPNPERSSVRLPAVSQVDVDITKAVQVVLQTEAHTWPGQTTTAHLTGMVIVDRHGNEIEGGCVLARYELEATE